MKDKPFDAKNRYFHVTPAANLSSILSDGIITAIGERSQIVGEKNKAVFLFPDVSSMENALMNWLGEAFEDEENLVILQIDLPDDFPVIREIDSNGDPFYECFTLCNISSEYISAIYDEKYNQIDMLTQEEYEK